MKLSGNAATPVIRLRAMVVLAMAFCVCAGTAAAQESPASPDKPPSAGPRRTLADLMESADGEMLNRLRPEVPRRKLDEARVAAEGIRKLASHHLILYTDLPSAASVDELPGVFDLAFPQWCAYFQIPAEEHADWSMTGFLIADRGRFERSGLIPEGLASFKNGYTFNHEFWIYEQETEYYRRHLLLHEGTHGFMLTLLGSCGPPWYMEGMAEMFGTHRWTDGALTLGVMPRNRDDVPGWGRTRIIQDALAARRALGLRTVFGYGSEAHQDNAAYAWSWAAVVMLDGDPRWRERFRTMPRHVRSARFQEEFDALFASDLPAMAEQWQVFVADLDYGCDIARAAVDFTPGKPLAANGGSATVQADRGWQNSGMSLAPGQKVRLTAAGRYQVAKEPQIWWCEPGGVSIRYYRGKPVGMLLAALRPEGPLEGASGLLRPMPVGLSGVVGSAAGGTLYFRINDSAGEMDDNTGSLTVQFEPPTSP